jgi:short-subunit dehydrogenase
LNVASTAAYQPVPYIAAYSATKSYVLYFSEALAKEMEDYEHSAPSVRTLKVFDITQVTTTKTLQFRHAVLGSG